MLPLNEQYTFENFIVGSCNRFPHAAAMAVADAPATAYNPFFLHGGPGLGKTHLLHAVCHAFLARKGPGFHIAYFSCESFVNQYIESAEHRDLDGFRDRFRQADALVIDDIHFLAGKERSQDEFFHTFNSLYNAQKQIILSSDSPPRDIPTIEDRLVSRFKWGLVAKIDPPAFETRISILKRKAQIRGREIPNDVAEFIANHVTQNVRELEGAVLKLLGYAGLAHRPVDLDLAREALGDLIRRDDPHVGIDRIQRLVAEKFSLKLSDLQSRHRLKSIAHPRQIGMYLSRMLTSYSLEEIGGYFGGRDHSTVIYAIAKIEAEMRRDPGFKNLLDSLEGTLRRSG
ncbi:MAG: chromosomal replication initiator protein DnaA [Planctomycetota bacterium]